MKERVLILGAGGRDFHNYNVFFKNNKKYEVVAFAFAQIPGVGNRVYPKQLAGRRDIPIIEERFVDESYVKTNNIHKVFFAYSDISYNELMRKASMYLSMGVEFSFLPPEKTTIKISKPLVTVCGVRTGVGKSAVSRQIAKKLTEAGVKVAVVRHPMLYSKNLIEQRCRKFTSKKDLKSCTIEEREEYEPYLSMKIPVWSGIDFKQIIEEIEDMDLILWDGGNNDYPFYKSDSFNFNIVVADALRPMHEISYYPSEINIRNADVIIINKVVPSLRRNVSKIIANCRSVNKKAFILQAASYPVVSKPVPKGKRILIVEDGPTITHGGMPAGIAFAYLKSKGLLNNVVNVKKHAVGRIKELYESYPHIESRVLPAVGYSRQQIKDIKKTVANANPDVIVSSTPADISRIIDVPVINVKYEMKIRGKINGLNFYDYILTEKVKAFLSA